MGKWTVFEDPNNRGVRKNGIRATINAETDLYLNGPAIEALEFPKAVELLFDEEDRRIGIRAADPDQPNSRILYQKPGSKQGSISIKAFCTRYNIKPGHAIRFDDAYVDPEGVLVLDLNTAVNASRSRRKI